MLHPLFKKDTYLFPLLQFPSALEACGICEVCFLNKRFKLKLLSIIHVNSALG